MLLPVGEWELIDTVSGNVYVLAFVIVFLLASLLVWAWMIKDCIKRKFESDEQKAFWIVILLITGIVGALIYLIVVTKKEEN